MAQPYVGEVRIFAGNFAPLGWMFCDGQLLPISEYETLFNLIGTTYGGDGQDTFALPDLRGRLPLHQGNGYTLAETGGAETVTLANTQIPSHNHAFNTYNAVANSPNAGNNLLGLSSQANIYFGDLPSVSMNSGAISNAFGGNQPHNNMMPYLGLSFIISLFGIFPSQ